MKGVAARLARRASPFAVAALTHPRSRDARRWIAERRRRLAGEPHRIHYFHQVDDPYSHLAAQVLPRLLERYDVLLEPHLVGPPPDDAAPERERLEAFARKDAADVAPFYGLDFPEVAAPPEPSAVESAARLLASTFAAGRFPELASRVGAALWRGDREGLEKLAAEQPATDAAAARRASEAGSALRQRLGHYLGAMFHYGGEWYWGADRLWHLERRLRSLGALREGASADPLVARPVPVRDALPRASRRLRLEFFPSLRSPYTAIAMRRVLELPRRLPVELVLRPVLPMVMRGLPVPPAKRLYIVLDTKREAEDAGEPFGLVCDPVGRPVERAFSLYPWARERGRAGELLHSFTRAAFAEGIDLEADAGLRRVVERAGLSWGEACSRLGREGWREELEENRRALLASGLWGVPAFRLLEEDGAPPFATWGQDRIWRVEEEIRRRAG
jgi:2-hydroxychromene-2-carboxylate isomerase